MLTKETGGPSIIWKKRLSSFCLDPFIALSIKVTKRGKIKVRFRVKSIFFGEGEEFSRVNGM